MQETYRFFIDAGADAVVNHHQHCISGYEMYNGKPIFYGLGNFCFDMGKYKSEYWNTGYMVSIEVDDTKDMRFTLYPYNQCSNEPKIEILTEHTFDERIEIINSIIRDENRLKEENNKYYSDSLTYMNLSLEPLTNRIIRGFQYRGWLPKYVYKKSYLLRLYDFLMCESHRDKTNFFLQHLYNKEYHK